MDVRWRPVYTAVIAVTIAVLLALHVFSAYFAS